MKILLLITTIVSLMSVSNAHFGVLQEDDSLSVEERGLPSNLAYLFAYSDAVVVVNHDGPGGFLSIQEVIHAKKGISLKKGEVIRVESNGDNYQTNARKISYNLEFPVEQTPFRKFSGPAKLYFSKPSATGVYFIRYCEVDEKIVDPYWKKFKGLKHFKMTNGSEGQFILDKKLNGNEKGISFRRLNSLITDQKKRWGYESIDEMMAFVRAYYSSKDPSEKIDWESTLGKRLRDDSVKLTLALSKNSINHVEHSEE